MCHLFDDEPCSCCAVIIMSFMLRVSGMMAYKTSAQTDSSHREEHVWIVIDLFLTLAAYYTNCWRIYIAKMYCLCLQ